MWHVITKQQQSIIGTPEAIIDELRIDSDLWFADADAYMFAMAHHAYFHDKVTLRTDTPAAFVRSLHDGHYLTITQEG